MKAVLEAISGYKRNGIVAFAVCPSRRTTVGLCLAGAWGLSVATHWYVIVPASVVGQVAADLATTEATAIWLVSAVPGTWALSNIVLGGWIDRFGPVRMIELGTVAVIACVLASWWTATEGAFLPLLGTRLVAGVAVGLIWTASADLIGGLVGATHRGTALGFLVTSAPTGFAIGQVLTPPIAATGGWPANFLLTAIAAFAALLLLRVGLRRVSVAAVSSTSSALANLAAVRSRPVAFGSVLAYAAYSIYLFLNSWLPTYLTQEFAAGAALAGLVAAAFPAVGIVSRTGGGILSDRLLGRRRVPVLQAAFLVSVPLIVGLALVRSLTFLVLGLIAAGFVVQLTFGVVYSYVRESVGTAVTGTALSVVTTSGMAGAFSAPIVTGMLIDSGGGFGTAFGYAIVLAVIGVAVAVLAPESPG
ncbi:MAG: nitrate/nitrite transporter [Salinirussus sp.]